MESFDKMMDKKSDDTYTMPDSATAMKNRMAYSTPVDMHKMLARSNGAWGAEITMWEMQGGPEQKATGTMNNKMVMGDHCQVSSFSGNMMGMPFEGKAPLLMTITKELLSALGLITWVLVYQQWKASGTRQVNQSTSPAR